MQTKTDASSTLFRFDGQAQGRRDITGEARTREASTLAIYAKHARSLFKQAGQFSEKPTGKQIGEVVRWFVQRDGEWEKSTIRSYRASLCCVVEQAASTRLIDPAEARALSAILETADTSGAPTPRRGGALRTSSKKRKSAPETELRALRDHFAKRRSDVAVLLRGLMHFGPQLGLRPIEYADATVLDQVLQVRCAKATNGRGLAPTRTIDLRDVPERELAGLRSFLVVFRRVLADAGSWARLHASLARALSRACDSLGIAKVSLYTLRHQMLATAKRSMTPKEVAALAGHKTTKTATQHYARRRSGWKRPLRVCPTPDMVERVSSPPTPRRGYCMGR